MPLPSRPLYLLLFCICSGLLVLVALSVPRDGGSGGSRGADSGPGPQMSLQPLRVPSATHRAPLSLRHAARRFLSAFLKYEVGDLSQAARQALRANASAGFAAELLAQPPRDVHASSPRAQISRLRIVVLSRVPGRALVSGSALRGRRPEQFSFLFEARRGAWRAVGPGE
jgi:hypothetical protein